MLSALQSPVASACPTTCVMSESECNKWYVVHRFYIPELPAADNLGHIKTSVVSNGSQILEAAFLPSMAVSCTTLKMLFGHLIIRYGVVRPV